MLFEKQETTTTTMTLTLTTIPATSKAWSDIATKTEVIIDQQEKASMSDT